MLENAKILLTGPTSQVAWPIARALAPKNEIVGLARFRKPEERARLEAAGVRCVALDLACDPLDALPRDFDYVLHLAHTRLGSDFPHAVQVNAVGAGLILSHCRKAKAALVMSSFAVYSPPAEVFEPLREDGDIGRAFTPWAPSSPVSKLSLEAVARLCARELDLPVVIPRLNTAYGSMGGLPVMDLDAVAAGRAVQAFADPYPHSLLHIDDLCAQIEPLLAAAHRDAVVVNWAGDEIVTQRQWCERAGTLAGREPKLVVNAIPGTPNGVVADTAKRRALTGPCRVSFAPAFEALFAERSART